MPTPTSWSGPPPWEHNRGLHSLPYLMTHPCLTCGACCASFRVDFSAYETQEHGGSVPDGLAEEINDSLCRMRGTDHVPPRCAALTGRLGERVACGIYEWRPSPCREFEAGSDACNRARRRHGLAELDGGPY